MVDLEELVRSEWDIETCDSTECYRDEWEPADNSVTAILILAALCWYPLVRWVLVPLVTAILGDW